MNFTGGTVNLVNSQLYGSTANGNITIDGNVVVNMVGDSAISTSTKADLFVKGGSANALSSVPFRMTRTTTPTTRLISGILKSPEAT